MMMYISWFTRVWRCLSDSRRYVILMGLIVRAAWPVVPYMLVLLPTAASAAGFDCHRAHTPLERLLCSNAALSRADAEMGEVLQRRLAELPTDQRAALLALHRNWLRFRLPECGQPKDASFAALSTAATTQCLLSLYRDHIEALQATCKIDDTHTPNDFAAADRRRKVIPHGFEIVGGLEIYKVIWGPGGTRSYILPSTTLSMEKNTDAGLLPGYEDVALCSVRSPEGMVWLVTRSIDGSLFYVPAANTEIVHQSGPTRPDNYRGSTHGGS